MTRSRARGATQVTLKGSFNPDTRMPIKVYTAAGYVFANAGNPYCSTEINVHPISTFGSILNTRNELLFGANTDTKSPYINVAVKSVKYKIHIANLDTFSKTINFLPISNASRSALGTNYSKDLSVFKDMVTTFQLVKNGVTGSDLDLEITVEPWKVEGYKSFDLYFSAGYDSTIGALGSAYTNLHIQQFANDATSNITGGCTMHTIAEFDLVGLQNNVRITT